MFEIAGFTPIAGRRRAVGRLARFRAELRENVAKPLTAAGTGPWRQSMVHRQAITMCHATKVVFARRNGLGGADGARSDAFAPQRFFSNDSVKKKLLSAPARLPVAAPPRWRLSVAEICRLPVPGWARLVKTWRDPTIEVNKEFPTKRKRHGVAFSS